MKLSLVRRSLRSLAVITLGALAVIASTPLFAADIQIEFLPPPMQGTISLGIYNTEGKLVRTLHSEADFDEFIVALNGLVTKWDGKDDQGNRCPGGAYRARGFLVGDLKLEGVTFHGNDWVTDDDSPRISRIERISPFGETGEKLLLEATPPGASEKKLFIAAPVVDADGDTEWKLTAAPEETVFPEAAPASTRRFTLQSDEASQLVKGEEAGEEPKLLFEKTIRASDTFEQAAPWLKFPDGTAFIATPVLPMTLKKNPLLGRKKVATAELRVDATPQGTVLATTDGLPLVRVSETPHLKWAVIGRPEGSKEVTIFESDGAVVAEFKTNRLAEMMAFDAGQFDLPKEKETPTPSPTPEPPTPMKE